jgi:hypothetical protein
MAKVQKLAAYIAQDISRPGVHAKKKNGTHKGSKNYAKPYKGQGR